jgi:hypothetical protein
MRWAISMISLSVIDLILEKVNKTPANAQNSQENTKQDLEF